MSDLPVFAFCEPENQAEQVKSYLKNFGADEINERSLPTVVENLNEIIAHLHSLVPVDDVEIESVLNSTVSLFTLVPRDQTLPLVEKFCAKVSSEQFAGKEAMAIRGLSNLFHAFGGASDQQQHQQQYLIYCTMLTVAGNAGLIRLVITDLERVRQWFENWNISVDERRRCLRLMHTALIKSRQVEAPAKVMFALLSSYTDADAANAKPDARQCIRSAVMDPGTFAFDHLLELPPVQSLKGEKIFDLLKIFVSLSLDDYLKFYTANKEFIHGEFADGGDAEAIHSANVHKMRVLTLMTIGGNRTDIPLAELSQMLGLNDDEDLEEFIIKAVQSKAVKAKIDHMNRKLIIGGVKHRSFDTPQWETLRSKLDAWANSLHHVKTYLDQVAAAQ